MKITEESYSDYLESLNKDPYITKAIEIIQRLVPNIKDISYPIKFHSDVVRVEYRTESGVETISFPSFYMWHTCLHHHLNLIKEIKNYNEKLELVSLEYDALNHEIDKIEEDEEAELFKYKDTQLKGVLAHIEALKTYIKSLELKLEKLKQ